MKLRVFVAAAVTIASLSAASAVQAATWKRVTAAGGQSTDEVALLRTGDGVLHVAWPLRSGDAYSVWHTPISPRLQVGTSTPVVSGWVGTQSPALVQGADGLRLHMRLVLTGCLLARGAHNKALGLPALTVDLDRCTP
jgi:hypothetical protein